MEKKSVHHTPVILTSLTHPTTGIVKDRRKHCKRCKKRVNSMCYECDVGLCFRDGKSPSVSCWEIWHHPDGHDSHLHEAVHHAENNVETEAWNPLTNLPLVATSLYCGWILLGLLFYSNYEGWTYATAFYYAVEAGLSVGYCYPAERDDWSKLFTIGYILLGSSVVSGSLGFFASNILRERVKISRVDYRVDSMPLRDHESDQITIISFLRFCWYQIKYWSGWYTYRTTTTITGVFLFWMALGVVFAMVAQDWTFIHALHWTITSASTGGLDNIPCIEGTWDDMGMNCEIDSVRASLVGFWLLIGVPVYAIGTGQFADLAIIYAREKKYAKILAQPVTKEEFMFAANLLSDEGSTTLVLGEYMLLELMRLGQTDGAQIETIRQKFLRLDEDDSGQLSLEELTAKGHVVPKKVASVDMYKRVRTASLDLLGRRVSNSPAGKDKPSKEGEGEGERKNEDDGAVAFSGTTGSEMDQQKKQKEQVERAAADATSDKRDSFDCERGGESQQLVV